MLSLSEVNIIGKRLKIGIIGCGEIAVQTAKAIHLAKNAEIGIVMDIREYLAKDLGMKYNVPYTTDLDEVLKSDIDAVYIATPHDTHADLTIKAAEAGKHVLVEKPIATNLEDADRMIEACRKAGVKLSVCFVLRYSPPVVKAKELIDANVIGNIIGIHTCTLLDKPSSYWEGGYTGRVKNNWRAYKKRAGGGVLIMNVIHNIDYLRYATGLEVIRAYSEYDTLATPVEVEDCIVVSLRYSNKAVGSIVASSCAKGGIGPFRMAQDRIMGDKGQIILNDPLLVYVTEDNEKFHLKGNKWNEIALEKVNPRQKYVEAVAEAILSDKEVPITGDDGRKALEVVIAAYKSLELGRPVNISELR